MGEIKTDTKKIESYSAKVDKNGMKIMSWGLGLLNQLVTAGDSVGEMYKNIKGSGQSKVSTQNMSQEINTLSSFVNQFSQKIENKQVETKNMCNNLKKSNDNYVTGFNNVEKALSGGSNSVLDNETNHLISSLPDITNVKNVDFGKNWSSNSSKVEGWDDYTGQVKKFTDSVISSGYSTEQLNNLIEDNNKNIQDLRAKVKSGKLSEEEIKETKLQMKGLGELSKQLLQSYGTVSQTDHENQIFTNNYINNNLVTDDKKLGNQIEKDLIEYNKVINNENSSVLEKGLASKNINTLMTMKFMTNDGLFDDKVNENIEKQVSEKINNYVKNGLNTDTIKELLDESSKQVTNKFKTVIESKNMSDEELSQNIYERKFYSELSKGLEKLALDSQKKDKKYEKWEDTYEKKYENLINNKSLKSSDIQDFISNIGKDVKEIQTKIKSGNLTDAEKMVYYRKLKVLGQYNEALGKNYGIVYNNEVKVNEILNQQKKMEDTYNSLVLNCKTLDTELEELCKKQSNLEKNLEYAPSSERKNIQKQYDEYEQQIKQKTESLKDANKELSEFMCTVDPDYKEKYDTEQQLQNEYDKLFQYQSELYSQTGGNVQSFYHNMICQTQSKIKKLESKLGYDENNSLNQTAINYRKVQEKLNDLTNHASEYTEDEYSKQFSSLSAQLIGYEQQMFWDMNKDKYEQLINTKNLLNDYDKTLVSSNNSTEIQQINANKISAQATLEKLKTELGLDESYDISVAQTLINNLQSENQSLLSENNILRKQLLHAETNGQSYDIQEQIAENDKKISDNQKLIEQKNITINQLKNSNLVDAAKQLDGVITTLYQENAKLSNQLDFIGPKTPEQQEQLLLNNQQIEQAEALKRTYLDLSKMDANNGIENNINSLLNKYISETNSEMSTKKLNYYDNQVMQLLSVRDSVYQTKNSNLDALIEDKWKKIENSTSSEEISILKQEIEQLTQEKENETLKYSDSYNKANEYWLKVHPPEPEPEPEETIIEDNRNWWEVAGATAAQTVMTVWHGVENATESVLDFGVNAATGIISLGTSAVDLIGGNFGSPNCITQQLYNWKDDFVATDWVGNAAESIYSTDFGKWVDQNSFNHNGMEAGILRGIGEVAGTLAFASLGASAVGTTGAAASGMAGASTTVNALSQVKNMSVVVGGIKGFGQGLETALQEGANTVDAQAYAIASGSWDATQWIIGQQINGWTGAQLSGSTSALKSAGIFAASVGMDAVDSGIEGFVQPALQTIYKDDSYANIFKENGGWENVGTQAAIGGILSAVSTAPDFVSSMKNVQIDAPTKVTGNQDILTSAFKAMDPTGVASIPFKFMETNLSNDVGLSSKALNEGLFHFTDLDSAHKIVDSGEIRASKGGLPIWYDTNKAYMFAGIPDYFQLAINMNSIPSTVMTAVRIKPTDVQLSDLKFRYMDDLAVSHKGNFVFDEGQADVVYFGITKDTDGNLIYREITEDMAKNYDSILAKEGIKTKTVGHGNDKRTIVDGTNGFDGWNKQIDITKQSIAKTLSAANQIAENAISTVKNISGNIQKLFEASSGTKISTSGLNIFELSESLKQISNDNAFKILSKGNNKYGVDQGLFTTLRKNNPSTYLEIKNKLVNDYHFSNLDAERFFSIVDSIGACNYACEANVLASYFKNMPDKFEEIFGFPLYKQNSNGEIYLNDAELLADLYYWGNALSSEAELFQIDSNGKTVFNENAILYDENNNIKKVHQRGGAINEELINEYLHSKNASINCSVDGFYTNKIDIQSLSVDKIKSDIMKHINNGDELAMITASGNKPIVYTEIDTGRKYPVSGGHWTKVMEVTNDGVIVSSWGKRCLVKFEDLLKTTAFDFFATSFNTNIN